MEKRMGNFLFFIQDSIKYYPKLLKIKIKYWWAIKVFHKDPERYFYESGQGPDVIYWPGMQSNMQSVVVRVKSAQLGYIQHINVDTTAQTMTIGHFGVTTYGLNKKLATTIMNIFAKRTKAKCGLKTIVFSEKELTGDYDKEYRIFFRKLGAVETPSGRGPDRPDFVWTL